MSGLDKPDTASAPTAQDIDIEELFTTYDVCALRAILRGADALLQSVEGYGSRNKWGESLVDVGFILQDAVERLDRIYKKVDTLELEVSQIKLGAKPDGGKS